MALDMGVGKTVISLSVLVERPMRTLVVMPLSLLSQWESEVTKHTCGLTVAVHHGNRRTSLVSMNNTTSADVVLTTYHTILTDMQCDRASFYGGFMRIIVDEAHKLRTAKSKTHIAVASIFRKTQYKMLLTGTPICNSHEDMVSLFCLLNHRPFNNRSYWKGMDDEGKIVEMMDLRKKHVLYMRAEDYISGQLPCLQVLDVEQCFNKANQAGVYKDVLTDTIHTSTKVHKILRLRQCSNDVRLLKVEDKKYCADEMSDKVSMVQHIVNGVPKGEKIIIFSEWLGMLKLLYLSVEAESLLYHGSLSKVNKDELINNFKTDANINVLFMTLKAGSVGLNLTEASHAILVEPYFNASEENQAMGRIYRIGQKRDVKIYKLRISNTVENWMRQLQRVKTKVADIVLREDGRMDELSSEMVEKTRMFDMFVNNLKITDN